MTKPMADGTAARTPNLIAVSNPTAPMIMATIALMSAPSSAPLVDPALVRSAASNTIARMLSPNALNGAGLARN